MKRACCGLLLMLAIGGCAAGPDSVTRGEDAGAALGREMVLRLEEAFDAGDAQAIAALFTEDAVAMPAQHPAIQGRDAIRAFYAEQFAAFVIHIDGVAVETRLFGDHGFSRGTYMVTLRPKAGGDTITDEGKYLFIVHRQRDGTWKATHDISNSSRS